MLLFHNGHAFGKCTADKATNEEVLKMYNALNKPIMKAYHYYSRWDIVAPTLATSDVQGCYFGLPKIQSPLIDSGIIPESELR